MCLTISVNNNNYSGFWSDGYNCILQANNIIKSIEALQGAGTALELDDYKAQASHLTGVIAFRLGPLIRTELY